MDIKLEKEKIIEQYGNWTAHNIYLGDGIYIIDKNHQSTRTALQTIIHDRTSPFPKT